MTTRSGIDLPALDAVLRVALTKALRAGRPPARVVLAVLARGRSQNVSPGSVRVWLRSRCADAGVRALVADTPTWRSLSAAAKRRVEEDPSKVRLRLARRAIASMLRGLPAGENTLIALPLLSMLDDPNEWDSAQITKRPSVILGVSHTSVQARTKKLTAAGVLTKLSGSRGVTTRVSFAPLPKSVKENYERYPLAYALVDALTANESPADNDAIAILRALNEPSIGYGALPEDAWNYVFLRALGATDTLSPGRIARARRALKDAGLDPNDTALFADAAADLSDGEPTALYEAAEAKRAVEAEARTASKVEAADRKSKLYRTTLPTLFTNAGGGIPPMPTTVEEQNDAHEWISRMTIECASALGSPMESMLRTELRRGFVRAGWANEDASRVVGKMLPKGTDK